MRWMIQRSWIAFGRVLAGRSDGKYGESAISPRAEVLTRPVVPIPRGPRIPRGGDRLSISFRGARWCDVANAPFDRSLNDSGAGGMRSIVIDEGFGSLDEIGQDQMVEELTALALHMDKVIVVSHLEAFRDREHFPFRLQVEKVGNSSVLRRQIA